VIREERIESFLEINKQRKETLGYLTQERQAILNELKEEIKRITDLIESERSATLVELEKIGQLIADNTIMNSKQLIDHIFIRILQFVATMIISLIIFVFIIYGIVIKRKKHS
jgi:4-hydroxy-3-methylbut-2-enyl diphosphate reductase IspH